MSREYPTVNESIAYDDGFADAKDYWVPRTEEDIIKLLEENSVCDDDCDHYDCLSGSFWVAIKLIRERNA